MVSNGSVHVVPSKRSPDAAQNNPPSPVVCLLKHLTPKHPTSLISKGGQWEKGNVRPLILVSGFTQSSLWCVTLGS